MQACNPNPSPNPNHAGVLEKLKAACLDWAFWGDSYTHVQPPRPMCLEAPSCAEAELVCNCRNFGAGHEDDLVGSWLDTDQPDHAFCKKLVRKQKLKLHVCSNGTATVRRLHCLETSATRMMKGDPHGHRERAGARSWGRVLRRAGLPRLRALTRRRHLQP